MKEVMVNLLALCLLGACAADPKENCARGILCDATMNTVQLVTDANDTLSFSTLDADKEDAHGLLLGDTLEVFYVGNYRPGMSALRLVSSGGHAWSMEDNGMQNLQQENPPQKKDGLGDFLVRTYRGCIALPTDSAVTYVLTVNHQEHSGDGSFRLTITKADGKRTEARTETYTGRRFTLRGTADNPDAVVWQLVTAEGQKRFDFLYRDEQTLVLLDEHQQEPAHPQERMLKRMD